MRRGDLRRRLTLAALLFAAPVQAAEVAPGTMLDAEQATPWHAVGRVNIPAVSRRTMCTGTLIAPDVVLTAAHCLVQPVTGRTYQPENIHFVAGWYKGRMTGAGVGAAVALPPDYVPGERTRDGLGRDIALVRLGKPLPAEAAMPFAVGTPPLPGAALTLVSYRRDRPNALTLQGDCPYQTVTGPLLLFECPVTYGASGAPVFAEVGGERRLVGILTAMGEEGGRPVAVAVRADLAVAKLLATLPEGGAEPAGQ